MLRTNAAFGDATRLARYEAAQWLDAGSARACPPAAMDAALACHQAAQELDVESAREKLFAGRVRRLSSCSCELVDSSRSTPLYALEDCTAYVRGRHRSRFTRRRSSRPTTARARGPPIQS